MEKRTLAQEQNVMEETYDDGESKVIIMRGKAKDIINILKLSEK